MRVCNGCGKNLDKSDHAEFSINYTYGFDSNYDQSDLKLDLCDECLNKLTEHLINTCKINPVSDCYWKEV